MERLQKVIAHAGVASRRAAEKLILAGRVTVNEQVVTELGTKVKNSDQVKVDGVPLRKEAPVYFMLNKPRGLFHPSMMKKVAGRLWTYLLKKG